MAVRKDTVQLEVIINGDKAGKTAKEMRANLRDLNREYDKLTPGTDAYNKKALEIAKATVLYNQHKKSVRDAVTEIETGGKRVNPFIDTLKKGAIAAGLFFGAQQIVQWGKQLVSWATRGVVALEDMRDKTAAVFGDASDIVQDFAVINAQALGVTEEKYASLASEIGAVLVQMGFMEEEAAQMSSQALNTAGAISEFSNGQLDLAQATDIVEKALAGQTKGLKQIGLSISDADVKARLMAEGQDKLTGLALKQAKAQATLQLIIERTGRAQAEFAASSDDAGRAVGRIGQYFDQVKENILSGLLPAYKAITNGVANFLSPLKRQSDLTTQLQAQFNIQIETLKRGNISQENRSRLIDQINTKYKEYLPNLITEKTSLSEINAIQDEVNKKFTQRILLLATEESLRDVSKELIKAKTEELDIAQKQIAAEQELAKFDVNKVGQGREGSDRAFIKAATAAQGFTDALEANKKKQDELQGKFEETTKAAQQLGLDINAILSPDTPTIIPSDDPTGDPKDKTKDALQSIEDLYNKERQLKIQSIEFLRANELEYNAERERINLTADINIARAQAELYKEGTLENLKLLQDAVDKEADIKTNAVELTLAQRTEQIERERDLRLTALREQITDEEDLAAQLEIVTIEATQRIAEARLATLRDGTPEYVALAEEIAEREQEIARKQLAETLRLTEEGLGIRRDMAIQALDGMQLTEEDYQKARERINLETDIAILQTRIALYAKDTAERLALEVELADKVRALSGNSFTVDSTFASSGGSSSSDDKDEKDEKFQQAKNDTVDFVQDLASKQLDIERNRIDQTLQLELDSIDRVAEAKRRAAGDDAVELAKIDAQARLAKEKAEKKAAADRKKLAIKEAIVNGALAIIKALPNYILAAAVAVTTAAEVAVIQSQTFAKGGYTPKKGAYRDHTGHEVAGVVHTDEWVAPKHMLHDPQTGPVISYLENIRRAKGGFADGGFTTVSTRPIPGVQASQTITSSEGEQRMIQLLQEIKMITAAWPKEVKARVVYTELEEVGAELNYIRGQANG